MSKALLRINMLQIERQGSKDILPRYECHFDAIERSTQINSNRHYYAASKIDEYHLKRFGVGAGAILGKRVNLIKKAEVAEEV